MPTRSLWKQLPQWIRNPYFVLGLGSLIWMFFFDSEDLLTQYKLRSKLGRLKIEEAYYRKQIIEIRKARKELASNEELLEKFAREKYLMKKKNEDVYIIEFDSVKK